VIKHITNIPLEKLTSILEFAKLLGRQSDFEEIVRLVIHRAASLVDADVTSIVMINPQTDHTIKTIMRDNNRVEQKRFHVLQSSVVGWVHQNKNTFISNNLKKDDRFRKGLFKDCTVHSALCLPFLSGGIHIGFLLLFRDRITDQFKESDAETLEYYAALCAAFLDKSQKIGTYFEANIPDSVLLSKYQSSGLLGKSQPFIHLLKAVESAARCDVRVLLEGRSGTGKELIAHAIHQNSERHDKPFVAVDCGAIPENLVESELFGHAKGAFTGAAADRKGLFEAANFGTLFIDEIENLPLLLQAKLLRVVQEGEFRPVGSTRARKVDVRIIAASSNALRQIVKAGRFREDLFYRLYVYPIRVPTLAERQEDIPLLASEFLKKFAAQQKKNAVRFDRQMLHFIKNYAWDGNVRELENFVERMVTLVPEKKEEISHELLPKEYVEDYKKIGHDGQSSEVRPLEEELADTEKGIIERALVRNHWNQSKAARQLKISERTMRYKINKLGLHRPRS